MNPNSSNYSQPSLLVYLRNQAPALAEGKHDEVLTQRANNVDAPLTLISLYAPTHVEGEPGQQREKEDVNKSYVTDCRARDAALEHPRPPGHAAPAIAKEKSSLILSPPEIFAQMAQSGEF